MKKYNIAIIGATGLVGSMFIKLLEEYNIPKEEFWEDPYGFIDKLEDEDLKWLLLMEMEAMD